MKHWDNEDLSYAESVWVKDIGDSRMSQVGTLKLPPISKYGYRVRGRDRRRGNTWYPRYFKSSFHTHLSQSWPPKGPSSDFIKLLTIGYNAVWSQQQWNQHMLNVSSFFLLVTFQLTRRIYQVSLGLFLTSRGNIGNVTSMLLRWELRVSVQA